MRNGEITISVWDCRAEVVKWTQYSGRPNTLTFDAASNWEDLEEEAISAVNDQGGAINLSGHYYCPAELADKAIFTE